MNAIQFIQSTLHELNRSYVLEVENLTTEQMFFRPTPDANSIAFLMWHFPRIEDSIFHSQVSKNESPTVGNKNNGISNSIYQPKVQVWAFLQIRLL